MGMRCCVFPRDQQWLILRASVAFEDQSLTSMVLRGHSSDRLYGCESPPASIEMNDMPSDQRMLTMDV